jgi:cellulose synthase/poly-beta-1,6-N-acetylglucosamine synthase-like glycosyltransferase
MVESSPYTLKDHSKQRKRWVVGTLQNLDKIDVRSRVGTLYRLIVWNLGLYAAAAAVPLWGLTFLYTPSIMGLRLINTSARWLPAPPYLSGGQFVFDILDGNIWRYVARGELVPILLGVLLSMSLFTWLFTYFEGFYLNKVYATPEISTGQLVKEFGTLACTVWFIGLLENLPSLEGVISFLQGHAEWAVTPKTLEMHYDGSVSPLPQVSRAAPSE